MPKTEYWSLPSHLRRWGLKVEQEDGWRYRGRPYKFRPRAIIVHHTASGSQTGNFGSLRVVRDGRAGLPGPLCQFLLGRDGTVRIIAGGHANHAGYGGPRAGVPRNLGNTYAWGIEAENNGIGERWSKQQLNAYYRLCAALLDLMGTDDVSKVFGHKEWTSRKIDPAGINMRHFRRQVKKALNQGDSRKLVNLQKLKPGRRNNDVKQVKAALKRKGLSAADESSSYFGRGLRKDYSRWQERLGYSGKDANGVPGRVSLERLGFKVINRRPKVRVRLKNLKPGKRNEDIRQVKDALNEMGFSMSAGNDDYFGRAMRHDYRHWQMHLGYRGRDADGVPGKVSLQKLGFTVVK